MKLTINASQVRNIEFGSRTMFEEGTIYVKKEQLRDLLMDNDVFGDVEIEIARAGNK